MQWVRMYLDITYLWSGVTYPMNINLLSCTMYSVAPPKHTLAISASPVSIPITVLLSSTHSLPYSLIYITYITYSLLFRSVPYVFHIWSVGP